MVLDQSVRQSLQEAVLCWLATADANGNPRVSPKEIFSAYGDDEIIIANIASPNSVKNLRSNPAVCVSFIHVFKQKGHQVFGTARYLTAKDDGFTERLAPLQALAGDAFQILGIMQIQVSSVAPIVAPSYRFVADTNEAQMIKAAMSTYGVQLAHKPPTED
jgi:predicted pyridoxine 5'-phosphate oxidase superfamily flavin-nucleotide-binding protein